MTTWMDFDVIKDGRRIPYVWIDYGDVVNDLNFISRFEIEGRILENTYIPLTTEECNPADRFKCDVTFLRSHGYDLLFKETLWM